MKYTKPKDMILYVKPDKIVNSRWPLKILSPNRKPREMWRAQ